jgi:hypothetical protein
MKTLGLICCDKHPRMTDEADESSALGIDRVRCRWSDGGGLRERPTLQTCSSHSISKQGHIHTSLVSVPSFGGYMDFGERNFFTSTLEFSINGSIILVASYRSLNSHISFSMIGVSVELIYIPVSWLKLFGYFLICL